MNKLIEKNSKYVKEFLEYLEFQKNYSKMTIKTYSQHLNLYLQYLEENKINLLYIEEKDMKNFIYHLYNQHLKASTISNYISSLKSFYKYLLKKQIISSTIMDGIEYPKKEERLPKILLSSELKNFFDNIDITQKFGKRNEALFYLLYTSGIRVGECCELQLNDINYNEQLVHVIGKGNKERIVPVSEITLKKLQNYILLERETLVDDKKNKYVFINNKGTQLTSRGIRSITAKICKQSSIKANVTPHIFRHTLASTLLNNGMDLRYIQEILGHENLVTTEIYTHLNKEELQKKYKENIRRK